MKQTHILSWFMLLSAMLVSCSENRDAVESSEYVECKLVLNVNPQKEMRQPTAITQADGNFRGLQHLWVLPFRTYGADVTGSDEPLLHNFSGSVKEELEANRYFYIRYVTLAKGTDHMLVYGNASPVIGETLPSQNGKLDVILTERMKPKEISFALASICPDTNPTADAQALADYMTAIANTTGWKSTEYVGLKDLYTDFINAHGDEPMQIPGSAANIKAYVEALKEELDDKYPDNDLAEAIKANIGTIGGVACLNSGYPSSIGLPDGAAVLRWTGSQFEVRTTTTTLDNINGINRYTYPAELWYYTNSDIDTSIKEVSKSTYESSLWPELLSSYYQDGKSVGDATLSVAVTKSMQYGVARLQTTLKPLPSSMNDAKNTAVAVNATKMPLKGIIIGGQHTVGYHFKPVNATPSDVDARFIYDKEIGTAATINTLVFQSYDGEKVPVILEFQNNTGQAFYGKDGVVYPGTKFYLVGQLDPAAATGTGDYANRVFTQDYTTQATMEVNSLAHAYNCMPDLLVHQLEIGVKVVTQWEQSTPTNVKL